MKKMFKNFFKFLWIAINFIIKKVLLFDRKAILLLCAQDGDLKEQLKLSKICLQEGRVVEAYAWADVARYQGAHEAKDIRDQAWERIPDVDKEKAQNLARKHRLNYTRAAYLEN